MNTNEKLRRWRQRNRIDEASLAHVLGLDPGQTADLIDGRAPFSAQAAGRFLVCFGSSAAMEVFGGADLSASE
jgi:plasmid maintenance system antidote protein VapI